MEPKQLFDLYDQGVITEHEVVARLYEQDVDVETLPSNWKQALLEFKERVRGRPLRSASIIA